MTAKKTIRLLFLTFFCIFVYVFTSGSGGCSASPPKTRDGELTIYTWNDTNPCLVVNDSSKFRDDFDKGRATFNFIINQIKNEKRACHVFYDYDYSLLQWYDYDADNALVIVEDMPYFNYRLVLFQTDGTPDSGSEYDEFDRGTVTNLKSSIDMKFDEVVDDRYTQEFQNKNKVLVLSGVKTFFSEECHSNNCHTGKRYFDNWEGALLYDSPLASISIPKFVYSSGESWMDCEKSHLTTGGDTCDKFVQESKDIESLGALFCENSDSFMSKYQEFKKSCFSETLGWKSGGGSSTTYNGSVESALVFPTMSYPDEDGVYEPSHRAYLYLNSGKNIKFSDMTSLRLYHLHFLNDLKSKIIIEDTVGDVVLKDNIIQPANGIQSNDYLLEIKSNKADEKLKFGDMFPEGYFANFKQENDGKMYYEVISKNDFYENCWDSETACINPPKDVQIRTISELKAIPEFINYFAGSNLASNEIEEGRLPLHNLDTATTKLIKFDGVTGNFNPIKYFNGIDLNDPNIDITSRKTAGRAYFLNPHDIKQIWCIGEKCGEEDPDNPDADIKYCLFPKKSEKRKIEFPVIKPGDEQSFVFEEKKFTPYYLANVFKSNFFDCNYRFNKNGRAIKPSCKCNYGNMIFSENKESDDLKKEYYFGDCECNFNVGLFECKENINDENATIKGIYLPPSPSIEDPMISQRDFRRTKSYIKVSKQKVDENKNLNLNYCYSTESDVQGEQKSYTDIGFNFTAKEFAMEDILCDGSQETINQKIKAILPSDAETHQLGGTDVTLISSHPWLKIAENGAYKLITSENDLIDKSLTNEIDLKNNKCAYPAGYYIDLNSSSYHYYKVHRKFDIPFKCIALNSNPLIDKSLLDQSLNPQHSGNWADWEMKEVATNKIIEKQTRNITKNDKPYTVYYLDKLGAKDCKGLLGADKFTLTSFTNPVYTKLTLSQGDFYSETCTKTGKETPVILNSIEALCDCSETFIIKDDESGGKKYCMPYCDDGLYNDELECVKTDDKPKDEPELTTVCSGADSYASSDGCWCASGSTQVYNADGTRFKCVKCETGSKPNPDIWGECIKIDDFDLQKKIKDCESTGVSRWDEETKTCILDITAKPVVCPETGAFIVTSTNKNCVCKNGLKPVIDTINNTGACGKDPDIVNPPAGDSGGGCNIHSSQGNIVFVLLSIFGFVVFRNRKLKYKKVKN